MFRERGHVLISKVRIHRSVNLRVLVVVLIGDKDLLLYFPDDSYSFSTSPIQEEARLLSANSHLQLSIQTCDGVVLTFAPTINTPEYYLTLSNANSTISTNGTNIARTGNEALFSCDSYTSVWVDWSGPGVHVGTGCHMCGEPFLAADVTLDGQQKLSISSSATNSTAEWLMSQYQGDLMLNML